jgi:hypothetical protein
MGSHPLQEATMFDDLRERAAAEYEEIEPESNSLSTLTGLLEGLTAQQRFLLSLMLFLNVVIIGCMCLIALGRIQF